VHYIPKHNPGLLPDCVFKSATISNLAPLIIADIMQTEKLQPNEDHSKNTNSPKPELPKVDEDFHAPAASDGKGISSGIEALKGDCGSGRVRGDNASSPGGGAAVPSEAGVEMRFIYRLIR
jgi:hypothetical protein